MARYKRIYAGEYRTVHKSLKLTPSEAAELGVAIVRRGVMWSDFVREAVFHYLNIPTAAADTRPNAGLVDALHFAGKAHKANGNLINQIAGHLNQTEELGPFTADLREALLIHQQIVDMHKAAYAQLTVGIRTAAAGTQPNAELIDALLTVGKNHKANGDLLNQIARHLNQTGQLDPFAADLREALRIYRQVAGMHKAALARLTAA
jgi:hypothetical protein